jgi:hypothetical protein
LALQGTLDTFSLPDVLRLLATTSKTGRLRIEGDRGQGSVWMTDGGIVDADAERAVNGTPTDEVVFELLRFGSGSFAFDGSDTASKSGKPEDVETLLRRANSLLSEWSELEAVVPSLEHQVKLAADLSVDEVTIDADRWKSLVAVAAGCTVGELATSLGLTELGVSRAVRDLVDLGVADVASPSPTTRSARSTSRAAAPSPGPAPALDRRSASPRSGRESVAPSLPQGPPGDGQRAGWLRTGEVPVVGNDRRAPAGNGHARAQLDDTVASPAAKPPPLTDPPSGGLSSRIGRERNAAPRSPGGPPPTTGANPTIGNGRARRSRGPQGPVTGANPAVSNGTGRPTGANPAVPNGNGNGRPTGATPTTPPPSRTNDGGRPRNGIGNTGPVARQDPGSPRRNAPEGPKRPASPRPPSRPSAPPRQSGPNGAPSGPSPFDGGRLGPSPRDTGQIRPVTPSSLPPDLHWAADDTGGGHVNGGPNTSPFSGLSSLGPNRPAPGPSNDGEIAPHVAAMSPEARSAVQATVGNSGGSMPGRGGQGEDIAQRGRLISFLSTVR